MVGNEEIAGYQNFFPFYTPVKDGTYYGITRGGRASGRAGGIQFFVRSISPKLL